MKNRIVLAITIMAIFISAAFALAGQPSENFSLPDLAGKTVRLSDHKGKVIFLNFFATWCPPCRAEMPSMQKLAERLKGKNFVLLAVSVDRDLNKLKTFVAQNKYAFKILSDADGAVAARYNVSGIPSTFIIDKKGKLVENVIGSRDWFEKTAVDRFEQLIRVK
jgi:peroxiredoxin